MKSLRSALERVGAEIDALLVTVEAAITDTPELARLSGEARVSAENLVAYLALRNLDLRPLQQDLQGLGLSSLGRSEARVRPALRALRTVVQAALGQGEPVVDEDDPDGQALLRARAGRVLGLARGASPTRIMVTLPTEAAFDPSLVSRWLAAGTELFRINSAHDDPEIWAAMVQNVREAELELGLQTRVLFDLAGPKLRTGPLPAGPRVLRLRPPKDELGNIVRPLALRLGPPGTPLCGADVVLPATFADGVELRSGDRLRFEDTRLRRRALVVVEDDGPGLLVHLDRTAWVHTGTPLWRKGRRHRADAQPDAVIGAIAARPRGVSVRVGESLLLLRTATMGRPTERDPAGRVIAPGCIGCTLPEALRNVEPGHTIAFDDGKIRGVVEEVHADHLRVRVDHCRPGGDQIRAEKGINLPDTRIDVPALGPEDREALRFAAVHTDLVGLSFVSSPDDVADVHRALDALGAGDKPIVLKIETRRAFESVGALLLAGLTRDSVGLMIARGDLAVELGFDRLAEVQEELLWVSEAAHVPVIWATEVLDRLAREGVPSRAEVTDAAMSERAECVMLNKGPHVEDAIRLLQQIFGRMDAHQRKKTALLRPLAVARGRR